MGNVKQVHKKEMFSEMLHRRIKLPKVKTDILAEHFAALSEIDSATNRRLKRLGMTDHDLLIIRTFFGA